MRVFISHSSKDSELATSVINLLRLALNLSEKEIRCTSVDGYRLSAGALTDETLRKELIDARVFIAMITPNSLASLYVNFEIGARWGTGKGFIPLLARGADIQSKGSPLQGINALDCTNPQELFQFVEECAAALDATLASFSSYQNFLNAVTLESKKINEFSGSDLNEIELSKDQLLLLTLFGSELADRDGEIHVGKITNELKMNQVRVLTLLDEMEKLGLIAYNPKLRRLVVGITQKGVRLLNQADLR